MPSLRLSLLGVVPMRWFLLLFQHWHTHKQDEECWVGAKDATYSHVLLDGRNRFFAPTRYRIYFFGMPNLSPTEALEIE